MKSFEASGLWWIPGNCNRKLEGTLVFDAARGGTIALDGNFRGSRLERHDIILGCADGNNISLRRYNELLFEPDLLDGGGQTSASVGQIFVGRHYKSSNDILFKSLSFGCAHLDEWMSQPKSEIRRNASQEEAFFDFAINLPNNPGVIRFGFPQTAQKPRRDARIEITAQNNLHFDHYHWYVGHLLNLFAVATGMPSFPNDIRGKFGEPDDTVKVYFKAAGYDESRATVSRRNMLFTLDDIQRANRKKEEGLTISHQTYCVPNPLNAWINGSNWLWEQTDLYIETIVHPSLNPKIRFLLLAQALESIHRMCGYEDKHTDYIAEAEFDQIARDLIKCIPPELNDPAILARLKPEIKRANEFSFASRLDCLCSVIAQLTDWDIEDLLGAVQGENGFVTLVKQARNDLTHYPKIRRAKRSKIWQQGLKYIFEMQVLLRIVLLLQMELPDEHVKSMLNRFRANNSHLFGNHDNDFDS